MQSLITLQQRSENGYGFYGPGLKTGLENGIFWSEIGSGFGEPGGTPRPRILRSIPPPPPGGGTVLNFLVILEAKPDGGVQSEQ